MELYMHPEKSHGIPLFSPVPENVITALREQVLSVSREEAYRWVPDDFDEVAAQIYDKTCRDIEVLTSKTAWTAFRRMVPALCACAPAAGWTVLDL